jgi:integrase
MLRTGLRAGEVCNLTTDAVITMRDGHWLKVPVGKLHNNRYIPPHPQLLELPTDWRSRHDADATVLLLTRDGTPLTIAHIRRFVAHAAATSTATATAVYPRPCLVACRL